MKYLYAVLRTGAGFQLTISDLYRPLCTMDCTKCGEFATFVYLPTVQRYCMECICTSRDWWFVGLMDLHLATKIPLCDLRLLLNPTSLGAGGYHNGRVHAKSALEMLRSRGFGSFTTAIFRSNSYVFGYKYNVLIPLPFLDRESGTAQEGVSCKGCKVALDTTENSEENQDHHIPYSTRIAILDAAIVRRDRVYSREGLLDHFQSCQEAQAMWKAQCSRRRT